MVGSEDVRTPVCRCMDVGMESSLREARGVLRGGTCVVWRLIDAVRLLPLFLRWYILCVGCALIGLSFRFRQRRRCDPHHPILREREPGDAGLGALRVRLI